MTAHAGRGFSLIGSTADWTWLYGPPIVVAVLAVPAVLSPGTASLLLVPLAAFPGLAHVLSTGVLYLDDSNRGVFKRHPATFYLAPAILVLLSLLVVWASVPWLGTALLLAAVYHNTRQSLGILNLTRRLGDATRANLRGTEEALVWTTNLACLLGSPAFQGYGRQRGPIAAGAWCAVLLLLGLYVHRHRVAGGQTCRTHLAFLLVSASLAWPLLLVDRPLLGWALMSFPHQVQYLGLFWTCTRRRYLDEGRRGGAHPLLQFMARDLVACFALLAGAACALLFLEGARPAPVANLATAFVVAATLCHYWLDAFVWRGSDPEMRDLLLGHLARSEGADGVRVAVA